MTKKVYYLDPHIVANSWEEFVEHFSGYAGTEIFGKISEIKMKPVTRMANMEGRTKIMLELEVSYQPAEYYLEDNSY